MKKSVRPEELFGHVKRWYLTRNFLCEKRSFIQFIVHSAGAYSGPPKGPCQTTVSVSSLDFNHTQSLDEIIFGGTDKTTTLQRSENAKIAARTQSSACELTKDLVVKKLRKAEACAGITWKRFPVLNNILKGFRPGELTIITGPTGCGKTTFLSEYSLDLCEQGVSTLWGSFEIPVRRHATTLMKQLARDPHLEGEFDDNQYRYWSKAIEQEADPGGHNVQHVIIDNLQFIMGANYKDNKERFEVQDKVVSKLRRLATKLKVHLSLVAHPTKPSGPKSDGWLDENSIFGSERTIQAADNIFILQQKALTGENTYQRYLEVVKNRYDGTLQVGDNLLMQFDKNTKCYQLEYKSKPEKETSYVKNENENNIDDF